jgi:hypothetical protein
MIKKLVFPVLIVTSLSSTPSFSFLWPKKTNKLKECRFNRYLFPIYKTSDNRYFVPIRNSADGLDCHFIEDPFKSSKNIENIWDRYNLSLASKSEQNSQERKKNFEQLENGQLIDFAIFRHCDWEKYYNKQADLKPFLLSSQAVVKELQDAKPFFDCDKKKTANLPNYGVVFQTSPTQSIAYEENLVNIFQILEPAKIGHTKKTEL